jgi:hypothetical protein
VPWRGNTEFPGLAYCVGGKSIYWGGWCPQLTAGDLVRWPASTAQRLLATYPVVAEETGVLPTTDFITGPLFDALRAAFIAATSAVPSVEHSLGNNGVEAAPLAVQGSPPASGLFSFDKFSSVPLLTDAIREDVGNSGANDAARRLFLVPNAHVTRLQVSGQTVISIEAVVNGQARTLPISSSCAVVLAASAIESTRLALASFPTPLMGRNLMAHVRSDFTVRIPRAVLGPLPQFLETAALLVRGLTPQGRFHLQVTAAANQASASDDLLFRMVPDIEELDRILANQDGSKVAITLRGIGEMVGNPTAAVPNANGSWLNLSPFEQDEFGVPRAWVQLQLQPADLQLWQTMDQTTIALVQQIAGSPNNIEYLYDGAWRAQPPPLNRPFPEWHRGLGTTYHEGGTLWMGDQPSQSVTNPLGRFHHVQNAFACDQSLFPTVGSVNPVLTGLCLARGIAEAIA